MPTRGGAWGGINVDNAFISFLGNVFSAKLLKELKSEEYEDYTDLILEFEVKKRSIRSDTTSDIVINLPMGLIDLAKKHYGGIVAAIKQSGYADFVSLSGLQKLCINPQTFRDLFKPTIDELLKHLKIILKHGKCLHLQSIMMVGGFSECELVQKAMKDTFPENKIIISETPCLAVLKGPVLYGHQPKQISRRIMKKTYGVQGWPEWDPELHPEIRLVRVDGTDRCKNVFFKLAVEGEQIEAGHSEGKFFKVLDSEERSLDCTDYVSDDVNPRYVTEPSCQRLGNVIVPLPPGESYEVELSLIFGETELLFRARNMKTGRSYETQFQF